MIATITIANQSFVVNLNEGIDLSMGFYPDNGPLAWGADLMKITPVRFGDWVGSVEKGAAVNFCDVMLNPHGQGTHTECVGHISPDQQFINDQLKTYWFTALLVEAPVNGNFVDLSGVPEPDSDWPYRALLVKTIKNDPKRHTRNYHQTNPPYFQPDQMRTLANAGVNHFMTELPSVDPEEDGGALAAHFAWFYESYKVEKKTVSKKESVRTVKGKIRAGQTITEFLYLPDNLPTGRYLLNLQIAPIANDAVPSRPLLYALNP
ncbi:MAG: cyclase family protein [Cryomorphaceae bacterium]|nr:cyclase family protein [Cryomorphaceae bacterium]